MSLICLWKALGDTFIFTFFLSFPARWEQTQIQEVIWLLQLRKFSIKLHKLELKWSKDLLLKLCHPWHSISLTMLQCYNVWRISAVRYGLWCQCIYLWSHAAIAQWFFRSCKIRPLDGAATIFFIWISIGIFMFEYA